MPGKKNKDVDCYTISGTAKLKGFVRNGLDSSTMINLIVVYDSEFQEYSKRGFSFPPDLFYYHEISWSEVIGVLMNEHKFAKEEAINSMKELKSKFNLQEIKRNENIDEAFENIVEEANNKVVAKSKNKKLKIGIQDTIIIGGFLRGKVNFIHSGDQGFLKTCEELDINIIPLPKKDIEKENQIKKLMKKGRN